MANSKMDFIDFDLLVESYVPLGGNRFLITFYNGLVEFYELKSNVLIREKV